MIDRRTKNNSNMFATNVEFLMIVSCVSLYIFPTFALESISLASQFLGTQNIGNEQVLLFKLPQSISSQMQEQFQQQQQQHQHQQQQHHRNLLVSSSAISNNRHYHQTPGVESQTISLTIPLSTLGASPLSQIQPGRVVYGPSASSKESIRFVAAAERPVQMNLPLLDYLASESSLVTNSDGPVSGQSNQQQQQPQQQRQQQLQQQQQQQLTSQQLHPETQSELQLQSPNLTANIEQQVRAFMKHHADQQSNTSSLPLIMPTTPFAPSKQEQQPQLWRDTQINQQENQKLQQEAQPATGVGASSLMAKLASSSPELLLRLKSLLHRAVQQKHLPDSHNGTSSESLKGLSLKSGSVDMNQAGDYGSLSNHLHLIKDERRNLAENGRTLMDKFLANQNLSSPGEVKVPLVVIAMPRISSLKGNQLDPSQPKVGSDSTQQSASPYAQQPSIPLPLQANITQSNNTANALQLIQLASMGQSSNANYSSNSTNSPTPYIYLVNDNNVAYQQTMDDTTSNNMLQQQQQQQQQQPSIIATTTTSGIQHTMAPYARQFDAPVSSTFMSQPQVAYLADDVSASHNPFTPFKLKFANLASPSQNTSTRMAQSDLNTAVVNSFIQYLYQSALPQLAHQLQLDPRIAYGRNQNITANEPLSYVQDPRITDDTNPRVQLAASEGQRELQPTVRLQPNSQGKLFHYDIQFQNEGDQRLQASVVSQQQQQQSILSPLVSSQDDQHSSSESGTSGGAGARQVSYESQPHYPSATGALSNVPSVGHWDESRFHSPLRSADRGQMLVSQPIINSTPQKQFKSRASLMEETLEKLRPLFQVKRRSGGKEMLQLPGNKLTTTNEMLGLMERSLDHSASGQHPAAVGSLDSEGRKAPKLVFMIV